MDQPFNTRNIHTALCQYMRSRPDLGVFKALGDFVLEPRNPFAPETARAPQRWFVFFMLIAALLLASFTYFGYLR